MPLELNELNETPEQTVAYYLNACFTMIKDIEKMNPRSIENIEKMDSYSLEIRLLKRLAAISLNKIKEQIIMLEEGEVKNRLSTIANQITNRLEELGV